MPPDVDTAYISHYVVYMAETEGRMGLQALGQVPVGTNELGFDELVLGEWRYWFVHWRNGRSASSAAVASADRVPRGFGGSRPRRIASPLLRRIASPVASADLVPRRET